MFLFEQGNVCWVTFAFDILALKIYIVLKMKSFSSLIKSKNSQQDQIPNDKMS